MGRRSLFYGVLSLYHKTFLDTTKDRLRILAYHSVDNPELFEQQIIYLKEHFTIIDKEILWRHIKDQKRLPQKSLMITFDDGEISVLEKGLPILKKHSIPAILFIISNLVNSSRPFWWKEIEYHLGKEKGTKMVWEVKKWNNIEREEFLKRMIEDSEKAPLNDDQLTISQLFELERAGVMIGNHSHTHPMFDKCTIEELEKEMWESFKYLNTYDFHPDLFAYPNGNHSPLAEKVLKEFKVEMAFLFDHKLNQERLNPLRISRIRVDSTTEMEEFKVKVSGLHSYVYHSLNKIKK